MDFETYLDAAVVAPAAFVGVECTDTRVGEESSGDSAIPQLDRVHEGV
jgi:hypothetical protein